MFHVLVGVEVVVYLFPCFRVGIGMAITSTASVRSRSAVSLYVDYIHMCMHACMQCVGLKGMAVPVHFAPTTSTSMLCLRIHYSGCVLTRSYSLQLLLRAPATIRYATLRIQRARLVSSLTGS